MPEPSRKHVELAWALTGGLDTMVQRIARALDTARAEQREQDAAIADAIGREYAEKDESRTRFPAQATCGAVACAVTIAAALREGTDGR